MKEIDFKTYKILKVEKSVSLKKIPQSVCNSDSFENLLQSGILSKRKKGRGYIVSIEKLPEFNVFFKNSFPTDKIEYSKSANIKKYRDSKARQIKNESIFFIRGFHNATINSRTINLKEYTNDFGLFAVKNPKIKTDKICFVENLDTFLKAEKLFGSKYIYLHKYGRIGIDSIKSIVSNEILVFVDYDFNGLDEFLRIKSVFNNATLFVPDNFETLFIKYSKTLKGNKAQMSTRVKTSDIEQGIKIREFVIRNNRFLEQEVLIDD